MKVLWSRLKKLLVLRIFPMHMSCWNQKDEGDQKRKEVQLRVSMNLSAVIREFKLEDEKTIGNGIPIDL